MLARQPDVLFFSDAHLTEIDFSDVGYVDVVVGLGDYAQRVDHKTQKIISDEKIFQYLKKLCKQIDNLHPQFGRILLKGNHEKEYLFEGSLNEMLLSANGLLADDQKYVPMIFNSKKPEEAYWLFVKSMPPHEVDARISEKVKDKAKFLCMMDHYKNLGNFTSEFDLSVSGHTHYKNVNVHQKKKSKKKKIKKTDANTYNYHISLPLTFINLRQNGSKKVKVADYNIVEDKFSKPVMVGNKLSSGYGMRIYFIIDDNNFPKDSSPRMHLNLSNNGSWMKTSNGTKTLTIHAGGYTRTKETVELYDDFCQYLKSTNNKLLV